MKKLKLVLISIILVVCAVLATAVVFLKTFNIKQYKSTIIHHVSMALKRDVALEDVDLELSLMKGISLSVKGLKVQDHPGFEADEFLKVDRARLNLDIVPLITKRTLAIHHIELIAPKLVIIRREDGKTNIQTLLEDSQQESEPSQEASSSTVGEAVTNDTKKQVSTALPQLLIHSISLKEAEIHYIDKSVGITIPLTRLDFKIDNFSLTSPFSFKVSSSLWSREQNINFSGKARLDLLQYQMRFDDVKMGLDFKTFLIEKVKENIPQVKNIPIKDNIEGALNFYIQQMIVGQEGLLVLLAQGDLKEGKLRLKDLAVPVEYITAHFDINESDMHILPISLALGSGRIMAEAHVTDYLKRREVQGKVILKDLRPSEIIAKDKLPVEIQGKLLGNFQAQFMAYEPLAVTQSLWADGAVDFKEARLVDINVLRLVLSKLSFIPNLVERLEANLPLSYQERLKEKDTVIHTAFAKLNAKDGTININDVSLGAEGFFLRAKAKADFNQNVSVHLGLFIEPSLSQSMVSTVEELSYLLNEGGEIFIPFKSYEGRLNTMALYPDFQYLTAKIVKNKGKDELKKVIFNAIGIERDESEGPPSSQETPQEPEKVSPEEEIIGSVLDVIFK